MWLYNKQGLYDSYIGYGGNNNIERKYEVICDCCNSKLKVKESELYGDSYSLPDGEEFNYSYIECPVCKKEIIIEANQILCEGVKEI